MFGDVSSSPRPPSKSHKVVYLQCGSRGHQFRTSRDLKTGEDSLHCEAVQPSVAQKQFQFGPGKAALRREWWPFRKEDHLFRASVYIYIHIYIFSLVFFWIPLFSLLCCCSAFFCFYASLFFLLLYFSAFLLFHFFLLLCIFAFLCFLLLRFFVCFSAFLLLCFFASLFFCLLFLCFLFSALYFFCIRCFLFFYLLPCCSAWLQVQL